MSEALKKKKIQLNNLKFCILKLNRAALRVIEFHFVFGSLCKVYEMSGKKNCIQEFCLFLKH